MQRTEKRAPHVTGSPAGTGARFLVSDVRFKTRRTNKVGESFVAGIFHLRQAFAKI